MRLPSAGALSWLLGEPMLAREALRLTGGVSLHLPGGGQAPQMHEG